MIKARVRVTMREHRAGERVGMLAVRTDRAAAVGVPLIAAPLPGHLVELGAAHRRVDRRSVDAEWTDPTLRGIALPALPCVPSECPELTDERLQRRSPKHDRRIPLRHQHSTLP